MNILKKLFLLTIVIICFACWQGGMRGMNREEERQEHAQHYLAQYKKLTENNALPVPPSQLKDSEFPIERTPQGKTDPELCEKLWTNVFFPLMENKYGLNLSLLRAAEQLVFTPHRSVMTILKQPLKIMHFCLTFTYCCQKNIIQESDDFIFNIKNGTCNGEPILYFAILLDCLQNKIDKSTDENENGVLTFLQYSTFELYMTEARSVMDFLSDLRCGEKNKFEEIKNDLLQKNSCSDLQSRISAFDNLPTILKKLYGEKFFAKTWYNNLPKNNNFINFFADFENNFYQLCETEIPTTHNVLSRMEEKINTVLETLEEKEKEMLKKESRAIAFNEKEKKEKITKQSEIKKKKKIIIYYLKIKKFIPYIKRGFILSVLGIGGGLLWYHKYRKR